MYNSREEMLEECVNLMSVADGLSLIIESDQDILYEDNRAFGGNQEMKDDFRNSKAIITTSFRKAKGAIKQKDYNGARKFVKDAQQEIIKLEKKLMSVNDFTNAEIAIGNLEQGLLMFSKCMTAFIVSIPLGGIPGAVYNVIQAVKVQMASINGMIRDFKKNGKITIDSFNSTKNMLVNECNVMLSKVDSMMTKIDRLEVKDVNEASLKKESYDELEESAEDSDVMDKYFAVTEKASELLENGQITTESYNDVMDQAFNKFLA